MKKVIFIIVFAALLIVLPVIIISEVLISPVGIIEDVVAYTGDVTFSESGFAYNDVVALMANYFEYGYSDAAYEYYFKDKIPEETRQLKNYYLVPCLLAGISEPSDSLIEQMTEAMIEVIKEEYEDEETGETIIIEKIEVLDAWAYAAKLKQLGPFSGSNLPIDTNTLGGYINLFASINGGDFDGIPGVDDFPGLSDEYLDEIKDGWAYPFTSYIRVTAHVGLYNPFGTWEQHYGTDFGAPRGTPIFAVKSGTVIAKNDPSCSQGCFVRVLTEDNLTVEYWHMAQPWSGNIGDYISVGDYIGPVGDTGKATGNHLHLEIRDYDTKSVIDYCQLVDCDNPNIGTVTSSDDTED